MKRLREIRELKGLTQQQVASHINKTFQAYSLYESGKRDPDTETLVRLAQFFNVSTDYLLGLTDNPNPLPQLSPEEMESFREWQKINNLSPYKQKIARKTIEILSEEEAATAQNS